MRQFIALALLSLYLFSSAEFSELLKFPLLAQHYTEHQQEQEGITFWEFVCQHYTHGDVDDDDKDKDMRLPYKSIDFAHAITFTVLPTIASFEIIKIVDFEELKSPINFYQFPFSSGNYSSIWQPPQIV